MFIMRRRSGAIHSKSEEEYVKLAEMAMNKTGGLFYSNQVPPGESQSSSLPNSLPESYEGFDAASEDEMEVEMEPSEPQQEQTDVQHIAIVVSDILGLCRNIDGQTNLPQDSELALMQRVVREGDKRIVKKYWAIRMDTALKPMQHSYLKRAIKVYTFEGTSASTLSSLQSINPNCTVVDFPKVEEFLSQVSKGELNPLR